MSNNNITDKSHSTNPASDSGLTPLMKQYYELKNENPEAILLFRCGDFFETFFDDAILVSKELNITLTSRGKSGPNPVPLAGVPHHAIDAYLSKLVQKGYTVAICEQLEDPKKAKGLVKRGIIKIITPGTISDPKMLDADTNNYLSSFASTEDRFCLVSVDISTGKAIYTSGDKVELGLIPEELTRLHPSEIICLTDQSGLAHNANLLSCINAPVHYVKTSEKEAVAGLTGLYPNEHRAKFLALPSLTLKAMGILSEHLLNTQRCSLNHIDFPKEYKLGDGMVLDEATLGNLELLPDGKSKNIGGTLFEVLNRTETGMGARMLKNWLLKPLINPDAINKRLDTAEVFFKDPMFLAETREQLKGITDLERLLSRVLLGGRNPRDLQALAIGLSRVPKIKELLLAHGLNELANGFRELPQLTELLDSTLSDDLPANLSDGGVIRSGVNQELDELRNLLQDGNSWLNQYEEKERQETGIKTLKVRKNSVLGFYIEISKGQVEQAPARYVRKQTLTNGERYITAELKDYENRVFTADEKTAAIERDIYEELVKATAALTAEIKLDAEFIAKTDVICSIARQASETKACKPIVNNSSNLCIKGGRHPVVERFLEKGQFTPNDTILNDSRKQAIITGPNMAGKSTYLRQTALIVLMAQAGFFVPAEYAEIGVTDRIFTRVGASDNLVRGQSTFMVEMMEASAILKSATKRSLLILDEIGRGTSTFDGLSLAWSILEHITLKIGARTLFATHYHELTDLESVHKGIFNLNISVGHDEQTDKMVFLHKIEEGYASKSYGIEVAKLAGLPESVIERAGEILSELEKTEPEELKRVTKSGGRKEIQPIQLGLFTPENEMVETLKQLDLNNMTPLDALNMLQRLKGIAIGQ